MPRPRKCRRVCEYPRTLVFAPAGGRKKETVNMTVDEYETIRLIDGEGYSQEQCGKQMRFPAPRSSLSTPPPEKSWRGHWWRG